MRKKLTKSIIYILILVTIFIISILFRQEENLLKVSRAKGVNNSDLIEIIKFCLLSFFGFVLGLKTFNNERKKGGNWKIDLLRIVILGIPSFIIGLYNVFLFWSYVWAANFTAMILFDFSSFQLLMQILFGYAIITSFYKE